MHFDEESDRRPIYAVFKSSTVNFQVNIVGLEFFNGSSFDLCECDVGVDCAGKKQAPIVQSSSFNTESSSNFFFMNAEEIRTDLKAAGIKKIDLFLLSFNLISVNGVPCAWPK